MRQFLAAAVLLATLAACATGPEERIVRGEFACDDGRRLKVAFNLDAPSAEIRTLKLKGPPVILPSIGGAGRNYSGGGYTLYGLGDAVTWTTPGAAPTRCIETR